MKKFQRSLIFSISTFFLILRAYGNDYWQNYVKYEIHVTLNDSLHTLEGSQWTTFKNNSPDTLDEIHFLLMPNAYKDTTSAYARQLKKFGGAKFLLSDEKDRGWIKVDTIKANGENLSLIFDMGSPDLARVKLPEPLFPGDSIKLYLRWEMKYPSPFSRLLHKGQHYETTQWYPKIAVYDKLGWHTYPYLEVGEFYGEFGTYDVYITLPRNYIVAATGDLQTESERIWLDSLAEEGNKFFSLSVKKRDKLVKQWKKDENRYKSSKELKTIHFHQKNVHDFAWFADKRFIVQKGKYITHDSTREVTLWSFALPEHHKMWEKSIEFIHDALYYYGKWYMEYPYNQASAVDGGFGGMGGMEYPNITVCSTMINERLQEMVIAHEVGHNWFYGIIGTDERHSAWMDEGLNTFSEDRYMVEKYGRNNQLLKMNFPINLFTRNIDHLYYLQVQYYIAIENMWDLPCTLYSEQYPTNILYSVCAYSKPAIIFRGLLAYLGEEKFNKAMKIYFEKWRYKHPNFYDLKNIFENATKEDLSWAFNDMIDGNKLPSYTIDRVKHEKQEGKYKTTVLIKNLGAAVTPVYIEAYSKKDTILKKWIKPERKTFTFEFISEKKPTQITIDPYQYIPEYTYVNNSMKPKIEIAPFFKPEKKNKFTVSVLPFIWYNNMDGLTSGIYAFRGFSMPVQNNYGLKLGYSFTEKKLIWSGKYIFNRTIDISSKFNTELKINDIIGKRELSAEIGLLKYPPYKSRPIENSYSIFIESFQIYRSSAFDSLIWDRNENFLNTGVNFSHYKRVSYRSRYKIKLSYKHGLSPQSFDKFKLHLSCRYLLNNTFRIKNYTFLGFISGQPPLQERFYASGNVDPSFDERTVFDRSGTSLFSPNKNYYLEGGPGLIGYTNLFYGKKAISTRFEIYKDNMGVFIALGDIATSDYQKFPNSDVKNKFTLKSSIGLTFDFSYLQIYFPFYLSHPEKGKSRFITRENLSERIFFIIRLPRVSFG